VTWTAADPPLAGDLDALKRLAASGAGWPAQGQGNWARKPEDLASGDDRKLADVLAAVPTGRLVVLGEPGSGKTMLMVGLVLDLLHPSRRNDDGPVPVLATLASWDPASQDLHGWLGATLITAYPDLAAAPPTGSAGRNRFEALLEAGLILPVLDGLDEIPEPARPTAITRINKELKPGEHAVVTCRTGQYKAAVSPPDGQGAALRAAAVQLNTLEFSEVASYLCQDADPAEDRWDFLDTLGADSPARQALATPLMTALARAIYNPRPDERPGDLPHAAELRTLADRATVEAHLFDAFIPAAYRPPTQGRWTAEQAEPWLVFLARHLERTVGSPDFAWWQLQRTISPTAFTLAAGLGAGLGVGLGAGLGIGLGAGLVAGLGAGLLAGLLAGVGAGLVAGFIVGLIVMVMGGFWGWLDSAEAPARGMRVSAKSLMLGLGIGLVIGIGLMATLKGGPTGLMAGLALGLGLAAGLAGGLIVGLQGVPNNLVAAASPQAVLARDRQVTLLRTLVAALVVALAFALAFAFAVPLTVGLAGRLAFALVLGLMVGLMIGLFLGVSQTTWLSYLLTRGWLAFHHRLPWSLMSFLADAHQRGVLRQAGAVYQFRHIELQHRLATRP
jgi:hypothetical protein